MNKLSEKFNFVQCRVSCGWSDLLWKLCSDIEALRPNQDFKVVQIKEKFGGLRFYVQNSNESIDKLISEAEGKSYFLCEECCAPGERRAGGWVKTLCSIHAAERDQRK